MATVFILTTINTACCSEHEDTLSAGDVFATKQGAIDGAQGRVNNLWEMVDELPEVEDTVEFVEVNDDLEFEHDGLELKFRIREVVVGA